MPSNTVSVIDGATCNAKVTSGCGKAPKTVTALKSARAAVNQKTDTVYVVNNANNTVSVINTATCNAKVTRVAARRRHHQRRFGPERGRGGSGDRHRLCRERQHRHRVGNQRRDLQREGDLGLRQDAADGQGRRRPGGLGVDQKTDTVYATNGNDNTVSVINGKTCNAEVTSGCGQNPPTVAVGGPGGAVVDDASHTVYVIYATQNLGGVAMINAATCNGRCTRAAVRHRPGPGRQRPDLGRREPGEQDRLHGEPGRQQRLGDQRRHMQRVTGSAA